MASNTVGPTPASMRRPPSGGSLLGQDSVEAVYAHMQQQREQLEAEMEGLSMQQRSAAAAEDEWIPSAKTDDNFKVRVWVSGLKDQVLHSAWLGFTLLLCNSRRELLQYARHCCCALSWLVDCSWARGSTSLVAAAVAIAVMLVYNVHAAYTHIQALAGA